MDDKPRKRRRKALDHQPCRALSEDEVEELIRKEAKRLEQIVIRIIMESKRRS
jgi:hypothetical protein